MPSAPRAILTNLVQPMKKRFAFGPPTLRNISFRPPLLRSLNSGTGRCGTNAASAPSTSRELHCSRKQPPFASEKISEQRTQLGGRICGSGMGINGGGIELSL
jgi:hypothetical protein